MENYRKYQIYTHHAKSMKLKTLNKVAKSVCKITVIDTKLKGTGFFLKIKNPNGKFKFLITTHHVVTKDIIDGKKSIEIIINNQNIKQTIILDTSRRHILCLEDKDITAIQIIQTDILMKNIKCLSYEKTYEYLNYQKYLNKDVFTLHYPKGEDLECASGKIIKINYPNEFEFQHTIDSDFGSSGSPILLFEDENKKAKVIGIHTSYNILNKNNKGIFIGELIKKYFITKDIYIHKLNVPKNSIVRINYGVSLFIGK